MYNLIHEGFVTYMNFASDISAGKQIFVFFAKAIIILIRPCLTHLKSFVQLKVKLYNE